MNISTHILDSTSGRPAIGVKVELRASADSTLLTSAITDADGRIDSFGMADIGPGTFRLVFDTGGYFADRNVTTFYPEVVVTFEITDVSAHYHVPLLLSPFAYSTYRGS